MSILFYIRNSKIRLMKTTFKNILLLAVVSLLLVACKKETSFEQGTSTASVGSLSVDASGNCLGAVVSGTYFKDTAIKASNYVDVSVKVDTTGTYTISSDTVNGYFFKASGSFTATGTQTVRLVGGGKPLATGTNIFTVTYNGTVCEFTVTVTAPTGGSSLFTVSCTGATPVGTYVVGTALTAANTITLNVNVTNVGSWSVTTAPAVNGIIFSGTGTFPATGAQTIVLTGSGTPTAAGTFNFTVTGGTGTCTFSVVCTAVAIPDYFPRTTYSNWSYDFDGDPTDSLLIYVISPTKTINGNTYNLFFYNDGASVDSFGYYRRSGADYFEWIDMGSYVGLDNPLWMEWTFLKDNLPATSTWTSAQFTGPFTDPTSGTTVNVTLRWEFTITQQNVSVTVTPGSGTPTSYPNTIQVKQELKQLVGTSWVLVAYFNSYYSKDKGLIKQDLFDNTNTLQYEQNVRRLVVY
jgi:hypothetical protein